MDVEFLKQRYFEVYGETTNDICELYSFWMNKFAASNGPEPAEEQPRQGRSGSLLKEEEAPIHAAPGEEVQISSFSLSKSAISKQSFNKGSVCENERLVNDLREPGNGSSSSSSKGCGGGAKSSSMVSSTHAEAYRAYGDMPKNA